MLRLSLASVISVLLLSSSFSPLSAQLAPDAIGGRMRGAWDLPVKDEPGRVRGVLFYLGEVAAGMEARLAPMPMPGDMRGGRIDGILRRKTDAGFAPEPLAEVHGTFVVGPDGRGRFEAVIVKPTDPGARPEPIGKMEGVFADPMIGDRDPIGRFAGRWIMRR